MQCATRPRITELNPHLLCVLCEGYLIDATAITECLHAFCKKCIVQYLETKKYCPVCDVLVHKTKPLQNIKPDKILQSIVYKSVPELYESEMCNRRKFYSNVHPQQRPENPELRGEITEASEFYTARDTINLSLEYINFLGDQNYFYVASSSKRYLRCDAKVTVKHLQKLISAKYGLATKHEIRFFFNGIQLPEHLTLLDIAYISSWKRNEFIRLLYQILEVRKTVVKLENKTPTTPKILQNEDIPVDKLPLDANSRVNNISEQAKEPNSTSGATATTTVVLTARTNSSEESSIAKPPKTDPKPLPVSFNSNTNVNNAPVDNTTSISTTTIASNICKSNENSVLNKIVEKLEKKASNGHSTSGAAVKPDNKCNQLDTANNNNKENTEKTPSSDKTPPPKLHPPITTVPIASTPVSSSLKKKLPQDCPVPTKIPKLTNSEPPKLTKIDICKEVESINTPIMSINSTASTTSASMKFIPSNPNTPAYNYPTSNKLTSVPALRKLPMCYPAARINSCESSKPVGFATTTTSIRKPVAEVKTFTRPWNCTTTPTAVAPVKPTTVSDVSKTANVQKPVKFHKARRNVPRFLGNPASGIRPMYQMNPSSANPTSDSKSDPANESLIKKLPKNISLLKVDPKTLAPITSSSASSTKSTGTGVNSNKKSYYSKLYNTMPEYPCSVTNTPNFVGSLPSSAITSSAAMAAAAAAAAVAAKLPSPGSFPSPYSNMAHNSLLNPLLYGIYPSHFPPTADSTVNGPTSLDYIKAMAAFHPSFPPPISSMYGPQHHPKMKHDKVKITFKSASSPPAIQRIPPTSKTTTTSEAASAETSKSSPISSAPSYVSNGVYKSKSKKEISSFAINNLIPIDEAKDVSHSCSADGVHQVCDQVSPTASSDPASKAPNEVDDRSSDAKVRLSDEKKDISDEKSTSK